MQNEAQWYNLCRAQYDSLANYTIQIAIKTMKKTFESFSPCLELREVIFLRSLPNHVHLVPALDIFLDHTTKKLHICMEYMDGNLYQLMKARAHRCLDGASVKSILYQILSGLDHIHTNNFFHRDIKPENILISTSAPQDSGISFRRYSALVTPPSTPPAYSIKIADFGLARETHSKLPYTTYVSTRWYRAPEVLLRAGEYSAPVDIWALGAMAVEIATLKPLFPGGNEVDQVWRVCEIMGSPGNWYNKAGGRVGGGDWREGTRLAQKLGFSFPKVGLTSFNVRSAANFFFQMAPHSMESILPSHQWPLALSNFVTWCLMWDPKNRPTSFQALNHDYFADAVDPLRPKSSGRLLNRKHSGFESKSKEHTEAPQLSTRASWFRKSLIGRDSTPVVAPQQQQNTQLLSPRPSPVHNHTTQSPPVVASKARPNANKRATWASGTTPTVGAPMPVLPSIRPVSPLSTSVTVQAQNSTINESEHKPIVTHTPEPEKKKMGRQLSLASHGNHYNDLPSSGVSGLASPTSGQKESFFSHLRKRARRLSGRNQAPASPRYEDIEASAGHVPFASNRSSMQVEPVPEEVTRTDASGFTQVWLPSVQHIETNAYAPQQSYAQVSRQNSASVAPTSAPKRTSSLSNRHSLGALDESATTAAPGPVSSRTRRALHLSSHPSYKYETPDEEDELLDEALHGVQRAAGALDRSYKVQEDPSRHVLSTKDLNKQSLHHSQSVGSITNPYPTPSPSAKRNGMLFNQTLMPEPATPINIVRNRPKENHTVMWPTPPYEENEWAASAAASIFAAGSAYR